jgi:hypothetical protein
VGFRSMWRTSFLGWTIPSESPECDSLESGSIRIDVAESET